MAKDNRITLTIPDRLPSEHTPLMKSLLELPRVRPLEMRQSWADMWRQFNWQIPANRTAALAQVVGQLEPVECESCMKCKGPFERCVTVPGHLSGGCGNCRYLHKDICSLRLLRAIENGNSFLPQASATNRDGEKIGSGLVERELGDEIETITIDSDSDGQSSGPVQKRKRTRRQQQLEQPRRSRRRLMRIATSSTETSLLSRTSSPNQGYNLESISGRNYTTGTPAHMCSQVEVRSRNSESSSPNCNCNSRAKEPAFNTAMELLSTSRQFQATNATRGPQSDCAKLSSQGEKEVNSEIKASQASLDSARNRYTTINGLLQALRIVALGLGSTSQVNEPRTGHEVDGGPRVEKKGTNGIDVGTLQNHSIQDPGASIDMARCANQEALTALFTTLEREIRLLGIDLNIPKL